ncbi:hypothetical protein CINF_0810 [Candidatus Campylobacter infans]|uniref:Uncharacterized protein n=1 Tax=Candidatus Campylobacter infans TaxID=2561898 RepID=A0A7H9CJ48_9BACT|nr:hypothetical protein [Candidatus Campylobacter infans]QLI05325.1 hypothetical protein CINF_0810 [Candidatus Campylobacter infans]
MKGKILGADFIKLSPRKIKHIHTLMACFSSSCGICFMFCKNAFLIKTLIFVSLCGFALSTSWLW